MNSEIDKIIQNQPVRTNTYKTNPIADLFYKIGIAELIIGIIVGILIIATLKDPLSTYTYIHEPHPLRWVYGISIIVTTAITALFTVGFGEIIRLLTHIRENTNK
ncbi:hypothetical protein ACFSTH_04765 [Paenibacillus yanchengensis]|uniref:Uncharacterized protein n=1 Tax=Paenibacillus yanchengensis TaxID=2035833 RepID=A0ABW4YKF3_9BACL